MTTKKTSSTSGEASKGTSMKTETAQTFVGKVKDVAAGAAEIAGAASLGKVAEGYAKTEAATEDHLSVADKAYFEAMGKIADKAESREERDSVREDLNKARKETHDNAKEQSGQRVKVFSQIAAMVMLIVGGTAIGTKFFRR